MSMESEVLESIRPSAEETGRIFDTAERLKEVTLEYVRQHGIDVKVRFVGSFAKGTFLSDPDLDLFLLFPDDVPHETLESIGLKAGEDILHGERMYSEHPYTRGVFEGLDVDMVPCYNLETTEKLQTAVDRTPFHTDYVLSRMDGPMKDEVRLLKKFMKGIEAYGAEPNTRGFSGYCCELLIIAYGGFRQTIEAASGWREGATITIEKKGPSIMGPLVIYDPVDPKRNVASAIHIDTFATFITAAKAYLANPSRKFFFPADREPMCPEALRSCATSHESKLLTVSFKKPDINEDNLYAQIWKTQYAIGRKLNEFSFNVLRAVHEMGDEEVTIVFELERDRLSKTYKHQGPPVWVKTSDAFLSKWSGNEFGEPFIEDGAWNVIAERLYFTATEMVTDEISMAGIGREIDPLTLQVEDHEGTLAHTDPHLLTELLNPKHSWEI
jgi:tRNA nucleotidyltransferase (CCA-adding enzyme)